MKKRALITELQARIVGAYLAEFLLKKNMLYMALIEGCPPLIFGDFSI